MAIKPLLQDLINSSASKHKSQKNAIQCISDKIDTMNQNVETLFSQLLDNLNYKQCNQFNFSENDKLETNKLIKTNLNNMNSNVNICPWRTSATIQFSDGKIASIRFYNTDTHQSGLWYVNEKGEYDGEGEKNLYINKCCYVNEMNESQIRSIGNDINYIPPTLALYTKIYVKNDLFDGGWFGAIVVGFDFRSRSYCVDYIDSKEWVVLYPEGSGNQMNYCIYGKKYIESWSEEEEQNLNEHIKKYENYTITPIFPPPPSPDLTEEYINKSHEMYVRTYPIID
eukprot:199589_1